jgi:hypothetical protein
VLYRAGQFSAFASYFDGEEEDAARAIQATGQRDEAQLKRAALIIADRLLKRP